MKLLAIDTSTEIASIALMMDDTVYCEEQDNIKTHARFILPMIDKLMVQSGLSMNQLDGVVFGCGPGSFTGLRIACSIAKGIAYAHDLGLIPVSSLGTIAYQAREQIEDQSVPVLAVLDARMQEMYWSYFSEQQKISSDHVSAVSEIKLSDVKPMVLAGVGIESYWSMFPDVIKSQVRERLTLYPNAAAMIRLAQQAAIKPISVTEAQPVYVRNQVTQGGARG